MGTYLQKDLIGVLDPPHLQGERVLERRSLASLTATLLRHRIAAVLRSNPTTYQQSRDVSQTLVYDYPSIEKLANMLYSMVSGSVASPEDRASRIEAMIQLNISKLEPIKSPGDAVSSGATVLLTGSTGGLGSQLLCALLKNGSIHRVFTFNRTVSTPASARQRVAFHDKGLDVSLLSSPKLVSLEGDLTKPYFALEQDTYNNVSRCIFGYLNDVDRALSPSSCETR